MEYAFYHPDQQIDGWIVNGKPGIGSHMPPQGNQLTDGDVRAIIDYLHTLWIEERLASLQDVSLRYPAKPEPTWAPQT